MIKAVIFDMYGVIVNPEQGFLSGSTKPFPEAIELIKTFSEKFILGLVSSASRNDVQSVLKMFGIREYFEEVVSNEDVMRGKPDPEPYLLIAKKLGLKSEECVVIEDSSSGVRSAKAAGMCCIAITTTHTAEDLKNADHVVNRFEEITEKLILLR